jgi:hypothetical protein
MAATSTTETWDAAWTLTMRAKRKRLTDNISDSYPTIGALRRAGLMETENGGKEIQEDLMYALNASEWFDGYDTLNTDAVDGITAAFYVWRYNATPITISMTEERENRKSDRAKKLLAAKTSQSMTTSFDTLNAAVHGAQSGKACVGFQDIMSTSSGTTLGGINATNETWWENGRQNYSTNQSTNAFNTSNNGLYRGIVEMGDLWNAISEGNDKPSHIFCSFATGGDYEDIFEGTGFLRTGVKDRPGVDGTDPHYRTVPLVMDRDNAATSLYMVNKKYLKFKVQAGLNFAKTPFREGVNQLAKVAFVVIGCQLTTNNRRRQGVLHTITN